MPEINNLLTWGDLATLAGASLLTFLIVQYTKNVVDTFVQRFLRFRPSTDQYAVLVGFLVLLLAQLGLGARVGDWSVWALSLANGFLIAAAAGHYESKALNPPGPQPPEPQPPEPLIGPSAGP